MADRKQVGGEVDAYCTKCRMILGHTIVAMVGDKIARVRCNTCMGDHAFRPHAPGTKPAKTSAATTRAKAAAAPRQKAEVLPFESLFDEKSLASAQRYSPKGRYAQGDVIEHPTFGLGRVESVRDDKLDAVFKQGHKTLIHSVGQAPASFEKTPRKVGEGGSGASSDKPPPGQPTGLHVVRSEPPTEMPDRED